MGEEFFVHTNEQVSNVGAPTYNEQVSNVGAPTYNEQVGQNFLPLQTNR